MNIQIVVLDDSWDDVGGWDALRTLSRFEFSGLLYLCIDVILAHTSIRQVIMSNVVYVVIVEESQCQHPRAWTDNLIDPLAMAQNGASLLLRHDNFTFLLYRFFIARHSNNQMHVWKQFLRLLKNPSMSDMIHVKYTICIHSDRLVRIVTLFAYILALKWCDRNFLNLVAQSSLLSYLLWFLLLRDHIALIFRVEGLVGAASILLASPSL